MDILVVGAGPAGSFASYLLAKEGHDVVCIEDHPQVGIPVQCTGIVTPAIEDLVHIPNSVIKTRISHARIFAPNNDSVSLQMKSNIILCRASFDQYLAEKAQDAGAQLFVSHRFLGHEGHEILVKDVTTNNTKRFTPDIIVGADGPSSPVAKAYSFYGNRHFFLGAQATVQMEDDHAIDFYPTPDGIFWSVPEGNGLSRVGVGVYHKANQIFTQFLAQRCPGKPVLDYQGGLIPVYDPALPLEQKNVYLVGDAATQVKATTAGGIIQSLIAAKCLAQAVKTGESYTSLAKAALGHELWLHAKLRQLMDRFTPEDYNALVGYTKKQEIKELLGKHDRDHLTSCFLKLLWHEPRYLRFALRLLRRPAQLI